MPGQVPEGDQIVLKHASVWTGATAWCELMAIAVTTRSYDNRRSGANSGETELTPAAVGQKGIRLQHSLMLPDDARGVEAQPLVVPEIEVAGKRRDVVYLATMANRVYAFDGTTGGDPLWHVTLGRPIDPSPPPADKEHNFDAHMINDHWGILGTPVIDLATEIMYVVAWTSEDGTVTNARHILHAIDIKTGREPNKAFDLEGVTYDPGHNLRVLRFDSGARKQRAALLLTKVGGVSTVFIAFGSLRELDNTSQGWVIACSTDPLDFSAAWTTTSKGRGAGIWQAGAGLAADDEGFIYVMTGNGAFDGWVDFGESFVKLKYTPGGAGKASLRVADWWTPFSDAMRVQGAPAASFDHPATATNDRGPRAARGDQAMTPEEKADMDLGSGGPTLIPKSGAVIGAGKDGILYVVNQTNMGKTTPSDLGNPARNYSRLRFRQPIFYTYFTTDVSPNPQNIQDLNVLVEDRTHHLHGNSLYWESRTPGPMLYCWGENGNLRAWSIAPTGRVTYEACSAELASIEAPVPEGGMPGGMLTLSANRDDPDSGVVWALIPYGDANRAVVNGRLLAYDATHFGTFPDGSKQIMVLWDSQRWAIAFKFNKFNPPVVANGRLIVPRYDGQVDVYGLAGG
jgi:PQQ enzyme repeat